MFGLVAAELVSSGRGLCGGGSDARHRDAKMMLQGPGRPSSSSKGEQEGMLGNTAAHGGLHWHVRGLAVACCLELPLFVRWDIIFVGPGLHGPPPAPAAAAPHTHTCAHMHSRTRTHTHALTHTHTYTQTHTHTPTRTSVEVRGLRACVKRVVSRYLYTDFQWSAPSGAVGANCHKAMHESKPVP